MWDEQKQKDPQTSEPEPESPEASAQANELTLPEVRTIRQHTGPGSCTRARAREHLRTCSRAYRAGTCDPPLHRPGLSADQRISPTARKHGPKLADILASRLARVTLLLAS